MMKLTNAALILLQWALIVWGFFLIVIALNTYTLEVAYISNLPAVPEGQDSYTPPTFQRMLTGFVTGLIAVGIGAVLYYLRRLYLMKHAE